MKSDEPSNSRIGAPLLPQRSMVRAPQPRILPKPQEAAARIIRNQIDDLYEIHNDPAPEVVAQKPSSPTEAINPYQRVHDEHTKPQADQWKQYHTAWQEYYQKYYEGYYTHHLKKAQQQLVIEKHLDNSGPEEKKSYFSGQSQDHTEPLEALSTEEAVFDLHQKLLGKVQDSAKKIKKSRHFIPILSGLIVVLIFVFLQYNRVIISNVMAYVSPGNIDPQNIVIDPNAAVTVGPASRLIIPKINVDVPVLYDIGNDYNSQMAAMEKGVAHFAIPGASSHPGQVGNTVLSGHSSNDLFDPGDYKFIFAQLDKLNIGDTVYTNYKSKRYTYTITKKEVVSPTQVDKLVYATAKPVLTLLTCTPLGTSLNRLLVTATQISPDVALSAAAPTSGNTTSAPIPGSSPTLFERIFGGGN